VHTNKHFLVRVAACLSLFLTCTPEPRAQLTTINNPNGGMIVYGPGSNH